MNPDKQHDQAEKRHKIRINDWADLMQRHPEEASRRVVELEDDRDFWRSRAYRLDAEAQKYAAQVLELTTTKETT